MLSPAPWLRRDKDATAESAGEETAFLAVKPEKLAASGDLDPMDGEEDGDEGIAEERVMAAGPLDPVLRCKIDAERGMSKRTAVGDDADMTGLRPSSGGLWLLPEPAYGLPPGLPHGGIEPLADVVTPESNGESPPAVAEVGERGSTMARAEADEMSALDDVSGLAGWDNKKGPAVSGRPSSLQSSKTESRLD